ncbi:MAG: hydrogenase maturation protease [Actinomycetota bacterium]
MRVVGVGNTLRGDDGAGVVTACRLATLRPDLVVETCAGEVGTLLDLLDGDEPLVVIDALRGGGPPGRVRRFPGGALPPRRQAGGTHDAGLGEALELAASLGRRPPSLTVIGIEGARYDLGHEALTPEVARACDALASALARELPGAAPAEGLSATTG